jgi:hypothetical protein
MSATDTFLSQVLGTVRHGVGHKDADGVLTSAVAGEKTNNVISNCDINFFA